MSVSEGALGLRYTKEVIETQSKGIYQACVDNRIYIVGNGYNSKHPTCRIIGLCDFVLCS